MKAKIYVIGAGAVGLMAAVESLAQSAEVVLFEQDALARNRLFDVEGPTHAGRIDGWRSGLGGSTQAWGGQLWGWSPHELGSRPYLGIEEWPVPFGLLERNYERVLTHLRVPVDARSRLLDSDPYFEQNTDYALRSSYWLPWRRRNFWSFFRNRLLASSNFTLERERRLVEVLTHNGAVTAMRFSTGDVVKVERGASVFLAGGTAANSEVLLRSAIDHSPWLGAGFMDHLSGRFASFAVKDAKKFAMKGSPMYDGFAKWTGKYVATKAFVEDNSLPSMYAHWEVGIEGTYQDRLRRAARRLQAGQRPLQRAGFTPGLRDLEGAVRDVRTLLVDRRRPVPKGAVAHLRVDVEQLPDVRNRLALVEGVMRLVWTHGLSEVDAARFFADSLVRSLDLPAMGLELIGVGADGLRDTYHMMGGTRMGASSQDSVTDRRGRVHGVHNLYALGASTFRAGTAGNPTLTALALALCSVDSALGIYRD